MKIAHAVFLALLLMTRTALAADSIEIDSGWARVSENGAIVDIYANLRNETDRNDAVSGATYFGPEANLLSARLIERDRPIRTIPIRQGHRIRLEPGGYALQLIGVPGQFSPNQQLNLAVKFSSTKEISLRVIIRPHGRSGPPTSYYERPR